MPTTKIIHNRLGRYDFCHPDKKSESYWLDFNPADPTHSERVEFDYDECNAPGLEDIWTMTPAEIIEELRDRESVKYWISTGPGYKTLSHEERIAMADKWAERNSVEDNLACAEVTRKRIEAKERELAELKSRLEELLEDAEDTPTHPEILPCPKCGSDRVAVVPNEDFTSNVKCYNCSHMGPTGKRYVETVRLWNDAAEAGK